MTSMTPDQFFSGGTGAPSFKFANSGDSVSGQITDLKVVQQTTYNPGGGSGDPKTWPSGDPMMQLNVTLQTSLRDPSIDEDDGKRRVYIDGRRIREAVKEAYTKVGAEGLEIGATYTQTFTGHDPASKNPANPAKVYEVVYKRPDPAGAFFGDAGSTASHDPASPASKAFVTGPTTDEGALQAALSNLSPEVKAALLAQAGNVG